MDGTCLAAGTVAGRDPFKGTRAEVGVGEDLVEVGWSAEVDSGGCSKEIVSCGFFSPDYLHYCDVYRCESGRCCTLPFFLTFSIILPSQVFPLY